jgi:hypothetical protein
VIWGKREGKSFCGQVWTGHIGLIPFANSLFARNRRSPDERSDIRGIDTRGNLRISLRSSGLRRFFRPRSDATKQSLTEITSVPQRATHEAVTRKLRWSAKSERCAMIVALILTDVTISL